MAFLRFVRIPKHQQFEYKPRYWNPEKEALEQRVKQNQATNTGSIEDVKARLSGGFRAKGYMVNKSYRSEQVKRSNMILLAITAALIFLAYLLLSNYLPDFAKLMESGN